MSAQGTWRGRPGAPHSSAEPGSLGSPWRKHAEAQRRGRAAGVTGAFGPALSSASQGAPLPRPSQWPLHAAAPLQAPRGSPPGRGPQDGGCSPLCPWGRPCGIPSLQASAGRSQCLPPRRAQRAISGDGEEMPTPPPPGAPRGRVRLPRPCGGSWDSRKPPLPTRKSFQAPLRPTQRLRPTFLCSCDTRLSAEAEI